MASMRRIVVGALAALLSWTCMVAAAEPPRAVGAPAVPIRIDGLDVEEVPRLDVGTRLNFSLFGTPDAVATLQIDGARHGVRLRESEKGVYEGTYVIDEHDRITADGQVVATLRRGHEVTKSVLDEPLVLGGAPPLVGGAPSAPPMASAVPGPVPPVVGEGRLMPPVSRVAPPMREWEARERGGFVPGRGAPGRPAESPAAPRLAPGGFDADSPDDTGPKASRAPVESRLLPAFVPRSPRQMPAQPLAQACTDCAVVESIRTVETGGSTGVGGTIAGGLLGAILGHEIAHGDLRGFARVLGAVGGALTGRAIERASNRQVRYDVVLRLPNGASQVHSYDSPPPVRVGDVVPVPAVTYARAPGLNRPD
jgi:hypothetical protein